MNKIDQITLDIIKDSLAAVGEEMFITIAKSSKSPLIYETLDFASGITAADGKLVTQGNGVAGFVGMLSGQVETILKKYKDRIYPGDIYISNDPYVSGGSHLSDVGVVMPIFFEDTLVALGVTKAHWTEVGGKEPGSWSTDATEVFQEGIQFPCLKLAERGEMDQNLLDLIAANVRLPEQSLSDMWSQIAGLKTAEKRINEICNKFGKETFMQAIDKLLINSEESARRMVRELPQGTFEAEEWIEDDGLGSGPIKVKVKLKIEDGKFVVDFSGTHGQVKGPINLPYSATVSACRMMFLVATDSDQEVNDGVFAPIEIIAEKGSIVNCQSPASVSICWETMLPALDAMCKALAKALPLKIPASNLNTVGAFILSGTHPDTGETYVNVGPTMGGHGAGYGMDGQCAQFCLCDGETFNIPVEVLESRYGFYVEEYSLNTDVDAGAGEWRGGSGLIKRYRMRSDNVFFSAAYNHFSSKPWGFDGGQDGSNNYFEVFRSDGSVDKKRGNAARLKLDSGDVLKVTTCIGGGYGNPRNRKPESVAMDVKNGYITTDIAEKVYGVNVSEEGEIIDIADKRI